MAANDKTEVGFTKGMQFDPGVYLIFDAQSVLRGGLYVAPDPNNPNHTLEYWALASNYAPLGSQNVNRGALTFPYQAGLSTRQDMVNYLTQHQITNTVHIMASCTTGGW